LTRRLLRPLAWVATGGLVVLTTRTIVYAVSPAPLAAFLEHKAGGPALPTIALVSLGSALAFSTAIVWLAALGVRERALLANDPLVRVPALRLRRLALRALLLFVATSFAFAYLESFIHWRAGLGWHGLHCLTGPVHRDAIPVLGALSLVAAAVFAATEHVLAWLRRTISRLAGTRLVLPRARRPSPLAPQTLCALRLGAPVGARAPPLVAG
jgi:hypothetical protein